LELAAKLMRNAWVDGLESPAVPLEVSHQALKGAGNCFLLYAGELMTR
jgi:hypothetical protein